MSSAVANATISRLQSSRWTRARLAVMRGGQLQTVWLIVGELPEVVTTATEQASPVARSSAQLGLGLRDMSPSQYKQLGIRYGVLVEGIPELYRQCKRNRPRSRVFNCALVAPGFAGDHVEMHYASLMSVVDGSLNDPAIKDGLSHRWGADSPITEFLAGQPRKDCTISLQNHNDEAWFL